MTKPIRIDNRRELFWDDYLIDPEHTTAQLKLHKLQSKEIVIDHNEPWEGDGCDFHCIVPDDGLYRMYYLGWEMLDPGSTVHPPRPIVVCYAESKDGINWIKPNLGICEFGGSTANNIILDRNTGKITNFSVFKDSNPDCPVDERYKGVGLDGADGVDAAGFRTLWCFTSADGIHFKKAWPMTSRGKFDTLNIAFWDRHSQKYRCYIRDFHDVPGNDLNAGIRDVRWMVSDDFRNWSVPVRLDFGEGDDYPLYTNVVQPYYRADHVMVGFPSRYVEKKRWTSNFDRLAGAELRKERMMTQPRYGLAVTDCVFMSSRDGARWNRWDEAFLTPGLEREINWVYGDCFPALGMIETSSDLPHAPNELSMYAYDNHWTHVPAKLRRYTIRVDGFVSRHAAYKPQQLVTKPFIYEGGKLSINFATSAVGYVRIKLIGDDRTIESDELFGDSLDRHVDFEDGDPSSLAGKSVKMEITMRDANLYSFQFHD